MINTFRTGARRVARERTFVGTLMGRGGAKPTRRRRAQVPSPPVEVLEERQMLAGVSDPGQFISLDTGEALFNPAHVNNAGGRRIVGSSASGLWSDAATWGGVTLGSNDIVKIGAGHTVTLDTNVDVHSVVLYPGGHLKFSTNQDTSLRVVNLFVLQGSLLEVGSENSPIQAGVTAEIVFKDTPLSNSWSNGLVVTGKVRIHGEAQSQSFTS